MGILRDFEKRLEGAVEGFFARAFRSGLQPVELAKAIQRYAGNSQQVGLEGVFVPNVYRFRLSKDDVERFSGFGESLKRELAGVVRRTADERGWAVQGPVRIEIESDDRIAVGTYELRGKVEAASEQPRRGATADHDSRPPSSATAILPASPGPRLATLRVVSGPRSGRRVTLSGDLVIGRLPDCDLTLNDPSVSRRHARVRRNGNRWVIEDLGSTNGVRLNGSEVAREELQHGDDIELGTVRLEFGMED